MDFMISMFGSESTGRPRSRRHVRVSADEDELPMGVNGLRGSAVLERAEQMAGNAADLPPEDDEGNVEYKLQLLHPSAARLEHLVTQLKWRLREGQGEAIYEIGVEDSGVCAGLSDDDLAASLATLRSMADALGASTSVLRECGTSSGGRVAEVLVRKVPDDQQFLDLRVAVIGGVDAGKSTLVGVLSHGHMDNGRGKARLNLFRHLHEVQSGRTSSISLDVLGFDSDGNPVEQRACDAEELCERATKLVTLIDLAGHPKYLKTTIFGLTGYRPHCAMLLVAADAGVVATTREHLGLALALQVAVFVVVTKADLVSSAALHATLRRLDALLQAPGVRRQPRRVRTDDDAVCAAAALGAGQLSTVPVLCVSSVTGRGLPLLRRFLNVLPPCECSLAERQLQQPAEFHVDELFNVPQVGLVAAGLLLRGVVRENDELLAGPDAAGCFRRVRVDSVHRNKAPCRVVQAGQAASVALALSPADAPAELVLRKGAVLVDPAVEPVASTGFEAEVYLLFHPAKFVCVGFQATVHVGNVCQTATMVDIVDAACVRPATPTTVRFVFLRRPEFLTLGSRLLFRAGKTKGIGQVTRVCLNADELRPSAASGSRSRTF